MKYLARISALAVIAVLASLMNPTGASQQSVAAAPDSPPNTLTPLFASEKQAKWPTFILKFKNDTDHTLNIITLIDQSSITLDGVTHKIQVVVFNGNASLRANGTYTYYAYLGTYIAAKDPMTWPNGYSSPPEPYHLPDGSHVLTVDFGGRTYGPAAFYWNQDTSPNPSE